ncbi:cytochrome b [Beggiatoa alba B18LD]|uniref:Cytochrome b n=2 Tax=Beggiatoa alba TaxID=1022 RepID=I3CCV0_9GAMM|nr:cytochrome b [Beggiatoa alba B18LD]
MQAVRVWDIPTRLFHWLLVLSFALAWFTHEDDRYLHIHLFAGYVFFSLLLFRLCWGFIGSYYARFSEFTYSLPHVFRYLSTLFTSERQHYLGHNPIGGWAVFLLLCLSLGVSATGFLTQWAEEQHGLFAGWFSFATGDLAHTGHELLAEALLILVGVHVLGVIGESWLQGENLIRSLFSGKKQASIAIKTPVIPTHPYIAGFMLAGLVGASLWYFWGYFQQTADNPYIPIKNETLPRHALWEEECGACHLAYSPVLLPARSWQLLLSQTQAHFQEDLALDADTLKQLQLFAQANAADQHLSEAAWHIDTSTPQTDTPQRITETVYWREKHAVIPQTYWQSALVKYQGNCAACHLDAEQGSFEDSAMSYPALP